jgi:hypothetical protein
MINIEAVDTLAKIEDLVKLSEFATNPLDDRVVVRFLFP